MQRHAITQKADAQLLHEIKIGLPVLVVAALLHLVHAHSPVLNGWVRILNARCEDEMRRRIQFPFPPCPLLRKPNPGQHSTHNLSQRGKDG